MKNYIKYIYNSKFHKVSFFRYPVSAAHDFFQGTFLKFFLMPFSVSEFAGFKKIYISNVHV